MHLSARVLSLLLMPISLACGGSLSSVDEGPVNQCEAVPMCLTGEYEVDKITCSEDAPPACHARTTCGKIIYCKEQSVTCEAYPACDAADKEVPNESACLQDDAKCYQRSICGSTIWCTGPSAPSLIPDGVTKVTASSVGGFAPVPPAGSPCAYGDDRYDYDNVSHLLAYERCVVAGAEGVPLKLEKGQRVLNAKEQDKIFSALGVLSIPTQKTCGADKPLITVGITSTSQPAKTFVDSFYACNPIKNGVFVDNIDGVISTFRTILFPSP